MSYWEGLDKKVQEYANKNGLMYVIDEEPFLKNPTGKPIILDIFPFIFSCFGANAFICRIS